jgi:hypothetical protein
MKHAWSRPAMLAAVLVMGTAVSAHAEIAGEKLYKQQ